LYWDLFCEDDVFCVGIGGKDMKRYHSFDDRELNPETLALGYGYDPKLSEGSVKPPIFLTSTFQFETAEEGKRFFELAYGLRKRNLGESQGLIYSRLNNPNLQIFEERMAAWDRTECGAVFASGMAAISTTLLTLLKPGDQMISSMPIYGGTHYLFANPSNVMIDIAAVSAVAKELSHADKPVYTIVDNTFLGPVFQRPALQGADLVIYSATKFIGGHSDLIAGLVTGPNHLMEQLMVIRTILGTVAPPFSGWLLLRSLETLSVRMRQQAKTAQKVAQLLADHPRVKQVNYPELMQDRDAQQYEIYKKQCTGPGSLISFEIDGGEAEAFRALNRCEVIRLAVSLGGTESLIEHPMSMTHSDIPPEQLQLYGVMPGTIRMSVGLEHYSDLKRDLLHSLE
jgi:methionine-gamma-lyase